MKVTRLLGMMALVALPVVQLVGCASTMKVASAKLCQGSGGTYANGTCTPGTKNLKGSELCAAHGGLYMAGDDTCELQPTYGR